MKAVMSECGRYRYALWRDTNRLGGNGTIVFVMLNPSTADAIEDDPTIRRCVRFAGDWGFAELVVGNAYALRSPDPAALATADDPVGPENDEWLRKLAAGAQVIAAWGVHIGAERETHMIRLLSSGGSLPLYCLEQTRDGHPKHPLYIAATTRPRLLEPRRPTDSESDARHAPRLSDGVAK